MRAPLAFFAGIWTGWHGVRGSMKNPRDGDHQHYAFLTTDPNGIVKPIHPKAMPVILTNKDELEMWLTAPREEAKAGRPISLDRRLTCIFVHTCLRSMASM
jgi:putative SOS response-associated peptidase YedK